MFFSSTCIFTGPLPFCVNVTLPASSPFEPVSLNEYFIVLSAAAPMVTAAATASPSPQTAIQRIRIAQILLIRNLARIRLFPHETIVPRGLFRSLDIHMSPALTLSQHNMSPTHPVTVPGVLEVITGPMFSGKSEELIRRLKRARIARQRVACFKPDIDLRDHRSSIASHSAQTHEATTVSNVEYLREALYPQLDSIE